ncbi:IncF replication protein RepA3 (plasmid) [Escherichia coli UMNF18]|nr:IncF replication protein RepA3 [Escherichia coli UMNF18]
MRHMNGEIKTGGEAHRFFHQFFAELQRSGTFTGCKHRIRVLYLAVIRLLKISHTILHLQCAEGVSTERSLELFRAYNYTPRIAELLAIRFLDGPDNLSHSPKLKKIIGVFTFLAPVNPHQNQFPATLWRGQP